MGRLENESYSDEESMIIRGVVSRIDMNESSLFLGRYNAGEDIEKGRKQVLGYDFTFRTRKERRRYQGFPLTRGKRKG